MDTDKECIKGAGKIKREAITVLMCKGKGNKDDHVRVIFLLRVIGKEYASSN